MKCDKFQRKRFLEIKNTEALNIHTEEEIRMLRRRLHIAEEFHKYGLHVNEADTPHK